MSDNVPLEVVEKILKLLPIKSIIRFRSVSKSWKSLIDSSHFILHYSSHQQHLLRASNGNYVSIAEDDCFPLGIVFLNPPLLVRLLQKTVTIGCSQGLLCLTGDYREDADFVCKGTTAVIWNLSIRKAVAVVLPNAPDYGTVVGFGVCHETSDLKIVNMNIRHMNTHLCQVEVFTLSTGVWRSVRSNLPRINIGLFGSQVVVDGFIYWLAYDESLYDEWEGSYIFIFSFNLTSEEFGEVILPDSLAYGHSEENLFIFKLRRSLVVVERDEDEMGLFVWRMEDGVPKSFTKLFHIYIPDVPILFVLEFMKSGEALVEVHHELQSYAVYEPATKQTNYLGLQLSCFHYSYMETLLLLDQPDYIVYDAVLGKHCISKRTDTKGKMKVIDVKTEHYDNVPGEEMDTMEKFDPKPKEGIELLKKKFELVQQKIDLKRKKLELEQQKIDLKKKKVDMALLCADTSKMAPENLAVHQKLVAEILKKLWINMW